MPERQIAPGLAGVARPLLGAAGVLCVAAGAFAESLSGAVLNGTAALLLAGVWWAWRTPAATQAAHSAAASAGETGAAFVASMAHDLRQPLQAAGLFAATLAAHPLPDASRKLAQGLETATTQLSTQFEAVFAIARIDSGRTAPAFAHVGLETVFAQVVAQRLEDAHARELHLRHVASRCVLRTDVALLTRLLDGFLSYAIATAPASGVVLGCRPRTGGVFVEVWRGGEGLDADALGGLFAPGSRVTQALDDHGLGLVLAARIAPLLGARVDARSPGGRGSVLRCWLPSA
ncbi:MAG: HAMP domain-containing sensor histidine kinase [Candidatus Dactylopiibacterium sp.]|nr:HAMP domain-containing sensor histidine kinase [Candidatus Dactylopiibacterium sp.]